MAKDKREIAMRLWASAERNSKRHTTYLKRIPKSFGIKRQMTRHRTSQQRDKTETLAATNGQMMCTIREDLLRMMKATLATGDLIDSAVKMSNKAEGLARTITRNRIAMNKSLLESPLTTKTEDLLTKISMDQTAKENHSEEIMIMKTEDHSEEITIMTMEDRTTETIIQEKEDSLLKGKMM